MTDGIIRQNNTKYEHNSIEIETITNCNFKCDFCPNKTNPKKPQIMEMSLFDEIIEKVEDYKTIKNISISSYCEPTLNPNFEKIIKRIGKTDLSLTLYTNGTKLTKQRLKLLKDTCTLRCICFGVPSLDPKVFKDRTGHKLDNNILSAINTAIELDLPIVFSIPGTINELVHSLPEFFERYPGVFYTPNGQLLERKFAFPNPTDITSDRCGALKNKYGKFLNIAEPHLFGCRVPYEWLYILVNGDMFICCEDFARESIYANIKDGSIEEIVNSPKIKTYLDFSEGRKIAPKNWICRRCSMMRRNLIVNCDTEFLKKVGAS